METITITYIELFNRAIIYKVSEDKLKAELKKHNISYDNSDNWVNDRITDWLTQNHKFINKIAIEKVESDIVVPIIN